MARQDDSAWGVHNCRLVELWGGSVMLGSLYDQLLEILPLRPDAVVVHSVPEAIEETYASVVQALESARHRPD